MAFESCSNDFALYRSDKSLVCASMDASQDDQPKRLLFKHAPQGKVYIYTPSALLRRHGEMGEDKIQPLSLV